MHRAVRTGRPLAPGGERDIVLGDRLAEKLAIRLGDKVVFTLRVVKVGGSSVGVEITGRMGEEMRLRVRLTLVWIDTMKAARWPDAMRARLEAHLETEA